MIARLRKQKGESGFTLVELLVASTMGVVVMGAVASLVISAVRVQPKISKEAQNISSARWMLERLTHELRNGIAVNEGSTASKLSFEGYVRHGTCGGTTVLSSGSPAIRCWITYECSTTACTRKESVPKTTTGVAKTVFSGLAGNQIFTYVPSVPTVASATYVKATLRLSDPTSAGSPLIVSSGASLRNATLGY
ncbi:MAG TPA: type II secretion system protein [Solirubrobacterales bacterium]